MLGSLHRFYDFASILCISGVVDDVVDGRSRKMEILCEKINLKCAIISFRVLVSGIIAEL